MTPLKDQAIQTALAGDWNTALYLNQQILKENPDDIEALNRLALALTTLGKTEEAKKYYQKVLKIDNQNLIALKNLKRLNGKPNKKIKPSEIDKVLNYIENVEHMFLEEGGKTKLVELVNIAESKIISFLRSGEPLNLNIKRLKIYALNNDKTYIGMLPDDLAKRLIRFLKGGNIYKTYVKSAENNKIIVFIKELKRSNRFKNQPSFTTGIKMKAIIPRYSNEEENENEEE